MTKSPIWEWSFKKGFKRAVGILLVVSLMSLPVAAVSVTQVDSGEYGVVTDKNNPHNVSEVVGPGIHVVNPLEKRMDTIPRTHSKLHTTPVAAKNASGMFYISFKVTTAVTADSAASDYRTMIGTNPQHLTNEVRNCAISRLQNEVPKKHPQSIVNDSSTVAEILSECDTGTTSVRPVNISGNYNEHML